MYKKILLEYSKEILHMRSRYQNEHFGLVFGAGTSLQLGFPSWKTLLDRIAESCTSLCTTKISNQPSLAQCLFQAFLDKYMGDNEINIQPTREQNADIKAQWTKLVINDLYRDVPEDIKMLKEKAKYLKNFIPIIKKSKLTINYNFDDSIQRLLNEFRTTEEKRSGKKYRTDWRPDPQVYQQYSVIYHPNGYLPKYTGEKPSDSIVLLDDAFGDQLIQSMAGKYTYLINHYAQNTCLFVGLSLEDPTLQNILRRNAVNYPGHIHYYIKYMPKGVSLKEKERYIIRRSNFETYNLVTLFLDDNGIRNIANLIKMDDKTFSDLCNRYGVKQKYVFYLTGCVAAGKTTTISYFRDLTIHDEWIEPMPEDMNKDPSLVAPKSIEEIDKFVVEQWKKKNSVLLNALGIILVDRCPLDAFGFTPIEKWKEKAVFLSNGMSLEKPENKLQNGMVIFLKNSSEELGARAISGLRETDIKHLSEQQNLLLKCYAEDEGIIHLDCQGMTRMEVAKLLSKIIHLDQYKEFNLHEHLKKIKSGLINE